MLVIKIDSPKDAAVFHAAATALKDFNVSSIEWAEDKKPVMRMSGTADEDLGNRLSKAANSITRSGK